MVVLSVQELGPDQPRIESKSDLCIGDSAFCDGIDLGFAWGLMTAFANLHGMDVGTACCIGAEVLKQEEQS